MTPSDIEISFELEQSDVDAFEGERRQILRAVSKVRFEVIAGLYLALGVSMSALGLASLAVRHGGFFGWQMTIEGLAFVCIAVAWYVIYVRGPLAKRQIGRRTTVEPSETDVLVTYAGRPPARYPWHRIARISQSVAGVAIAPRGAWTAVYVPARAMADGGDALYAHVAERIVSRRMLIARPEAFGAMLPRSVAGTVAASSRAGVNPVA